MPRDVPVAPDVRRRDGERGTPQVPRDRGASSAGEHGAMLPSACRHDPRKDDMDWLLILTLSLFGLAMAVATVFVIPSNIEPLFWLVIFIVCAYLIAKRAPGRPFLHG